MVKKRGLVITVLIVSILSLVNLFLFFNNGNASYTSMSGRFVEKLPEIPYDVNLSLVAFIAQWIILLLVIFFAYTRFLRHKKINIPQTEFDAIKQKTSKSSTNLDVLYNLLQAKKNINTKTISTLFKIPKEKAIEWAKILEGQELVTIEYPAFNDPEVRLNEHEKESNKKTSEEKTTNLEDKSKIKTQKQQYKNLKQSKNTNKAIKKRNAFLVFLFTIITLGIYGIYWLASTTSELRKNTKSAPKPWVILIFLIPVVNIFIIFIYFWKYSKAINELTGFNKIGLYILWIILSPIAMIISQIQLNKKAFINLKKDKKKIKQNEKEAGEKEKQTRRKAQSKNARK